MKACHLSVRDERFKTEHRAGSDTNDVNMAHLIGCTDHYYLGERDLDIFEKYDVVFITMSKIKEMKYENRWLEIVSLLREKYGDKHKIIIYQEAEVNWSVTRPIEDQLELFDAIDKSNLFIAHNSMDKNYFGFMVPNTRSVSIPTPMPIDKIEPHRISAGDKITGGKKIIIFGSTFDSRANAQFGLSVALELDRKYPGELEFVNYMRSYWDDDRDNKVRNHFGLNFRSLPRLGWTEFVKELSKSYISMNLMPAAAAGRDAIVFSSLGVPHIGNRQLDILSNSKTGIDPLDVGTAFSICCDLIDNNDFYNKISDNAIALAREHCFAYVADILRKELSNIGVSE